VHRSESAASKQPEVSAVAPAVTDQVSVPAVIASQPQLLKGKTVAITGGATGIGRAIAIGMSQNGANVAVNYFDSSQDSFIASLRQEIEAIKPNSFLAMSGDISKADTSRALIDATAKKFGSLDIFVSNAGVCKFHDFLDLPEELYQQTVRINLDGAFYATQAAANQMKLQGTGGSIIGVSSISALVGGAGQTHYTPTKAGVLSLMQSTATALGKYGIRCNAILPGTIKTQLNEEDLKDDEKRKYMEGRIPLGRTGVPEDIAGPAVFLASDLSKYVTGAQLLVDGGLFVNLQ
jgi:L-rhamnose 1-dehydrogenase